MKRLLLVSVLFSLFTGCTITSQRLQDGAYFVDAMDTKRPLAGLYLEVMVTKDEGSTFEVLAFTHTNEHGYFEFDERYGDCFDCWEHVYVYSDAEYTDTIGDFTYAFQDNLWAPLVLHTDTFSLEHPVWVIPRIGDMGDVSADKIDILFQNFDPIGASANQTYIQNITNSTTFPAVQMNMDLGFQHWFTFGSSDVAQGRLYDGGTEVGWGYFTVTDYSATSPGDSLYVDFVLND